MKLDQIISHTKLPANDPLGVSEADIPPARTLPPEVVVGLWNSISEDTGTLTETLLRFAALILEAADDARRFGKMRGGA